MDLMDMNLSKPREIEKDMEAWYAAVHGLRRVGHDWATEQQRGQTHRTLHTAVHSCLGFCTYFLFLCNFQAEALRVTLSAVPSVNRLGGDTRAKRSAS